MEEQDPGAMPGAACDAADTSELNRFFTNADRIISTEQEIEGHVAALLCAPLDVQAGQELVEYLQSSAVKEARSAAEWFRTGGDPR